MWIEESWNGLRPAAAEAQQAQRRDRHVHRACLEQAHYLLAASHSSDGLGKSAAVMTLLAISAASRVPIFDPVKEAETERVQLREKVESAKDSRSKPSERREELCRRRADAETDIAAVTRARALARRVRVLFERPAGARLNLRVLFGGG
jgi:hypothetical protein